MLLSFVRDTITGSPYHGQRYMCFLNKAFQSSLCVDLMDLTFLEQIPSEIDTEAIESLLEHILRLENSRYMGGWISAVVERWTFAGADDPTYTVSIPGDLTWRYWPEQRVRLQQAGGAVKHFINTGVVYSSPNTVLTLYGARTTTWPTRPSSSPISRAAKAPFGFLLNEARWRVECLGTVDSSQASPVAGTWYNKVGSLVFSAGQWKVEYAAELEVTMGSAGALHAFATLSMAANSEVNEKATTKIGISSGVSMRGSIGMSGYVLDLGAKGIYYLNCKTGQGSISSISFKGSEKKTRIRAVCGYLRTWKLFFSLSFKLFSSENQGDLGLIV
jgi:hypothetical protein